MPPAENPLEELLAEALAAFDERGEAGLQQYLDAHAAHRAALERGLARCRQMGLLGSEPVARDFPDRLGEFRLLRRLGSGGMGVVYEAEQESLGRHVAIKVVRPELLYFEGARERFRREIDAIARLSHPAIVPVLASGEQDGLPWYAMELLHGTTVHELCTALQGRDPATLRGDDLRAVLQATPGTATDPFAGDWWQSCTRIVHAIALGVRHAHLRGIVHRDIKPGNVMLTRDGRTVLLDFGIARVAGDREFTRTGNTPGSPAFMSPEQLRGDAVDERTDVYSLAATLWQMLTLVPPFRGTDALQRLRDGEAPPLRARNREVPPELELVVRTAMDPDRERRYHDISAFADDLLAVLQRRSIRARRLGVPLRVWRWCQRHRVTATALASLLASALLLPAVLAWRERTVSQELRVNFTTTLEAIQRMLVHVGDETLRHVPAGNAAAQGALADAMTLYRSLLEQHPDDTRLIGNAADALDRYASLATSAGDVARARDLLLEKVALLGGDRTDVPPGRLVKRALGHLHLADLATQSGDQELADRHTAACQRDLDLAERDPALRVDVARQRVEFALQQVARLDRARDHDAMLAAVRPAIAQSRQLCAQKGAPTDVVQLVSLLVVEATVATRQKRADAAVPMLEEALQLARSLPADAVLWPPASQVVAMVQQRLGSAFVQRRDLRAVPALRECLELREAAVRDHPHDVQLRSELGAALHAFAELNVLQDQDERAVERLDRAIALQRAVIADMPTFAQGHEYLRNHLSVRGTALARMGKAKELQEGAEALRAMQDPAAQRTAARHLLRLARLTADRHDTGLPAPATCHAEALACLLAAERLGWGTGGAPTGALYEPLRDQPEFVALCRRLGDGSTPAAAGDGDR